MSMDTATQLVERLLDPTLYGLPATAEVAHRQTHISHVFLAGERAVKIKKPVDFGFLDFTTLAARHRACDAELRLNRRLTEDVYQAVTPITREADGRLRLDGTGEVVEWAVVMRRLDDDAHLAARLAAGEDITGYIAPVAARLVAFYRSADTEIAGGEMDHLATVLANWDENLLQTMDHVGDLLTPVAFSTIAAATTRYLRAHGAHIESRARQGFVRDGHGDLKCEHVYLEPSPAGRPAIRVSIIDCVEFTERFRQTDIVNDLAYLGMDLERRGAPAAARALAVAYATAYPDLGAYALWDFFRCYRAYVSAKVAAFTAAAEDVPGAQQRAARRAARAGFSLAAEYAHRFVRPPCIVLSGPMGCGKSTIADALARHADLTVIGTDRVRKQLAGLAPTAHVTGQAQADLYAPAMSEQTYRAVIAEARTQLQTGRGVVLDGTFGRRASREAARRVAYAAGAAFTVVRCDLDPAENLRRLHVRLIDPDRVSDARPELLPRHLDRFEHATPDEAPHVLRCNLANSVADVEHAVLQGVFLS